VLPVSFYRIGYQFAVGGDQCLLGFNLADNCLPRREEWDGQLELHDYIAIELCLSSSKNIVLPYVAPVRATKISPFASKEALASSINVMNFGSSFRSIQAVSQLD